MTENFPVSISRYPHTLNELNVKCLHTSLISSPDLPDRIFKLQPDVATGAVKRKGYVLMNVWKELSETVAASGVHIVPGSQVRIGGGDINEAWSVNSNSGRLFVKFNHAARLDMFEAEAEGLAELGASNTVRVPGVVCTGATEKRAFLVLKFIDLQAGSGVAAARLGTELAQLHDCRGKAFGWHRNNTIGSTTQINTYTDDWPGFFRQWRLKYQLDLARDSGAVQLADLGEALCERLPNFFSGVTIKPALLHGDLWGGNWGAVDSRPVLYDPAVYYGDPESDLAMTALFGGFPKEFYDAYRAVWPDQSGGHQRRKLYRLYHVLNHFNLFGGGYARQAEQMIGSLLSEL